MKVLPFVTVILGLFVSFLSPQLIKVSKIECRTQYGPCPQELQTAIDNLQFTNLSQARKEIKKVLENSDYVSDYSTQFKIPNTVRVEVLVKKPLYTLNQKDTQNFSLVDEDGRILGVTDSTSLPTVIIENRLKNVGESVDEKELFALKLVNGVFSMYQVVSGQIKEMSLHIALPTGVNVIFPLEGDRDVLLGSLRAIYTKIEEEPGKYREIDLRFRNPVLR